MKMIGQIPMQGYNFRPHLSCPERPTQKYLIIFTLEDNRELRFHSTEKGNSEIESLGNEEGP
jgi:hypothetical protein